MNGFHPTVAPLTAAQIIARMNSLASVTLSTVVNFTNTTVATSSSAGGGVAFSGGFRVASGTSWFGGAVGVERSSSSGASWVARVTSDANFRCQIRADGQIGWGDGAAALDTFLSRSGSAALTLTGALTVSGGRLRADGGQIFADEAFFDYTAGGVSNRGMLRLVTNSGSGIVGVNQYFATTTKAVRTGFVGDFRFDVTTGTWAFAGTSASVAADATATLANLLTISPTAITIAAATTISSGNLTVSSGIMSATGTSSHIASISDSGTGTQPAGLTIRHVTSGTAATNFGTGLLFDASASLGTVRNQAFIQTRWSDATDGTRKAALRIFAYDTSSRECVVCEADGSAARIGFLGASASARISFAAASGTATRTTFDTATVTTADLAQRVKAIIDDLRTFGLYG